VSAFVEAKDLASKAAELDPDNPDIYLVMGLYAYAHEDFPATRRAAESRLKLAPKDPFAYHFLATSCLGSMEPLKAIELETQAINLDPKHPPDVVLTAMSSAYFALGDFDRAIEWGLKSLERNAALGEPYANLAMAYALKGDDVASRKAVSDLLRVMPKYRLSQIKGPRESSPAAYKEYWENVLLPAARKAGVPE
jgi:tetratricopeptide (TPR) repeat protein